MDQIFVVFWFKIPFRCSSSIVSRLSGKVIIIYYRRVGVVHIHVSATSSYRGLYLYRVYNYRNGNERVTPTFNRMSTQSNGSPSRGRFQSVWEERVVNESQTRQDVRLWKVVESFKFKSINLGGWGPNFIGIEPRCHHEERN